MARKTVDVTITAEGRDKGKVFFLTEMPADRAERWAVRALLALSRSGVELSDELINSGMIGFANLSLKLFGNISVPEAYELLDDMFACVQVRPSPNEQPNVVRPLVPTDIEEVMTRLQLRLELITLHVGFSIPGFTSTAVPVMPLY